MLLARWQKPMLEALRRLPVCAPSPWRLHDVVPQESIRGIGAGALLCPEVVRGARGPLDPKSDLMQQSNTGAQHFPAF